jgi:hypothetical protein
MVPNERIDAILRHHGIPGPWQEFTVKGMANRIYATHGIVLRIATDHPEAVDDARTESVAAPVARAAGLPVPRLLAFDLRRFLRDAIDGGASKIRCSGLTAQARAWSSGCRRPGGRGS